MLNINKIPAKEFIEMAKSSCRIVDVRNMEDFSSFHIPGSLYLNHNYHFEKTLEEFLFPDQAVLLVLEQNNEKMVLQQLDKLGFNNIKGILEGGINEWQKSNLPIDVVISITAEELMLEINHGHIQILDIRPAADFDVKHLEDSENVSFKYLISEYEMLDKNSEMCILCQNGELSMSLISYLKINGIHNIYHVEGGFEALEKSGYFKFEINPDLN